MVCKTFVLLSCVIYACVAAPGDSDNPDDDIKDLGTYMKRFDKINVEQILNNDRVLSSHLKCFLNEGPCVQQSRDLKRVIPVIAENACDGCTHRQKAVIKKSLNTLKNKKPNEWSRLVKIYDASGEKLNKFLES